MRKKIPKRLFIQIAFFILQNPLLKNFTDGKIYTGQLKTICAPGLNCYSCPAAIASCPVGAFQMFVAGAKRRISFYVAGFLLIIGAAFGRFVCGFVCPFGLLQDLLYRIKTPKRIVKFKYLRYMKYIVLILFVIVLPFAVRSELSGLGAPWFCEYICPSGTIFGALPLLLTNPRFQRLIGYRFFLKASVSAAVVIASAIIYRPFCRVLCPLGAFYSIFNKFSFVRIKYDREKCVSCENCSKACQLKLEPIKQQTDSPECVRCGSCVRSCPAKALKYNIGKD
jgi:polyferredoxin